MNDRYAELPARIAATCSILDDIVARLDRFEAEILPQLGKTGDSVLIPVQLLENGYTAIETAFLRISQAFENALEPNRWHTHLLEKMTLEVADTRPRVISMQTRTRLEELMRFRHFKRYYFQFEYDWRKIELLIVLFRESVPMVQRELTDFLTTLRKATEEE